MTLRRRVVLLVAALIAVSAVVFSMMADSIVRDGFDELVRADGRDRVGRLVAALDSDLAIIERSTQRMRTSAEALRFFHGNEPGFGPDRLGASARVSLGADATIAVDARGGVRYASDSATGDLRTAAGDLFHSVPGGPATRSGVLLLDSGPALVVAQTVTGPDRTNPPVGTLIFTRELTSRWIGDLSDRVGSALTFEPRGERPSLVPAPLQPTTLRYGTDGVEQASTAIFDDTDAQPALHVISAAAPELAAAESETVRRLVLVLLLGIVGSGLVLLVWFERRLLSRLSRLTALVRDAGGDGPREPVVIDGDDELSELAASTEHTLTSLEQTRRDLEATNRELVRANELRDDFVSMISHELRTPLTSVRGYATTIARHADEVPLDSIRNMADRIEAQGQILARMVDDLLTLSTARAGSLGTRPERLPVGAAVREALSSLPEAEGVPLVGDLDATVLADPEHLRRIIVNYVENAFKYGEEPIRIVATAGDGDLVVAVEDRGEGVPDEFRPHLFDRFTQASVGDRRTARGVGLGLSIVAVLAEANDGAAWYEQTSEGARFGVRLPLADEEAPADAPASQPGDAVPSSV